MKLLSNVLIKLIRLYQKGVSPKKQSCCRFIPTCSQYAIEAITLHGAFKGSLLSIWRILRCQPLCKGGFDPVPQPKKHKLSKK